MRFTEIATEALQELLRQGWALYTGLLVRNAGKVRLKDYFTDNQRDPDRKTLPTVTGPVPVKLQPISADGLDQGRLVGLVNMLYQFLGFPIQSELKKRRSIPAVVLVLPELETETRLSLMQAASAMLLPATGVITFSLDFFSEHLFQFYFSSEPHPPGCSTNPSW